LAGGIAHEFNNLLMGILGNTDLALARVQKGTPFEKYFDRIRKAAARAATLCRQMLAYSGQGSFIVENIDLSTTVEGMSYMLDTVVSKKAELSYQISLNVPPVKADAKQLQQLILNLVTNAAEALPESDGTIVLSIKTAECDCKQLSQTFIDEALPEGTYVILEVADNGHGMDSETIQKIFDPFFSTKFTGRGLGLSAVLGIIRGHKGSIEVKSEPNKGTSVRVYLPAIVKETFATVATQNAYQRVQGNGTILLVDDEEIIRATVSELLEGSGFKVITAANGHNALKLFEQHLAEIDAVLLDLTMPVMDGKETFRQLRLISNDTPVFFCSGHNEEVLGDQFSNDDLLGFIQKPFRLNVVLDKLAEVIPNEAPPQTDKRSFE
jgi:CheY-like chemotaxis protein